MMRTADFDYSLPDTSIAQHPGPRGESRLLRLDPLGHCAHHQVGDLPTLLRSGDLLVLNDTRVIPARLEARKRKTGGAVELLLVEKLSPTRWTALAKPAKRARPGLELEIGRDLRAVVQERHQEGKIELCFDEPIEPHLDRHGHVPLPPYIRRPDEAADRLDYQTVYASQPGAIAAPTAGLHFTRELLDRIQEAGIDLAFLTLHVGIGTFKPVSAPEIEDHRMEFERYRIPEPAAAAIAQTRAVGGRIVAVGTTVVRTLESAISEDGTIAPGSGSTDLFIRPGFRFRATDLLLTNFHLPRSTLLMLVCALAGRDAVLSAYRQALANGYRFYSYGDCMLVERVLT